MAVNPSDPVLLLKEHRKIFDAIKQFICVGCGPQRDPEKLSRISLWKPVKRYQKSSITTYAICKECDKTLSQEGVYDKVEAWMIDHGHVEL